MNEKFDGQEKQTKCKSCGATIVWEPYPTTGKMHPFNPDGTSHFSTCPQAKRWRQKQQNENQLTLFN